MSLLESQSSEISRFSWQRDLIFLLIWTLWLVIYISFELPHGMSIHGLPLVVAFGSARWGIRWGAFYLLVVAFIFSSFSIIPSGQLWTALFAGFLTAKLLQLRFDFDSGWQMAGLIVFLSILLDSLIIILMEFSGSAFLKLSFTAAFFVLSAALLHGIIGLALSSLLRQIAGLK